MLVISCLCRISLYVLYLTVVGSEMAKQKVAQVKESIERYKQVPHSHPGAPPPTHAQADCPPPYSTTFTQPYYPPTYQNTVAFVHGWPSRYVQFFYVLTPVHPRALRFIYSAS